ncbi:MAG TPA: ammonia-forming cytochrome c nitrite reductase subunit c552 [Bellilinea sp.]|nr:ammonia-forming cytochrome c nitrite reductase subunit c552 [Bellilinea sp.]
MKSNRNWGLVLAIVFVILAAAVVLVLIFNKNQPLETRGLPPLVEIEQMEPDSEKWAVNFPNQYSSMIMTRNNNTRTTYGGSVNAQKIDGYPLLRVVFSGYLFSKDYREDRGHEHTVTDVNETLRISDKTTAGCYSCKSANNPTLWAEMGLEGYDKMSFEEMKPKIEHPIGCANCHEANTMKLILTNPSVIKGFESQGKDWTTFTRQEMRSGVCANCHVEYSFQGEDKILTLPWSNGTTIEGVVKFYNDLQFADWKYPETDTPIIKMQHPDYELFSAGSTHYNAGVACADCHMPYVRDGSMKYSSHNIMSPLVENGKACSTCHNDTKYVVDRVNIIQDQTWVTMEKCEEAIIAAIDALKIATADTGADKAKLDEARQLHREAQAKWDFIAAENSMGFHNPTEALRILASATDLARQAQIKAMEAVTK